MRPYHRNLLLAGKLILAIVLLSWVVSKVHGRDYVVDAAGRSYPVLKVLADQAGGPAVLVRTGLPWWGRQELEPLEGFQPAPATGQIIRAGLWSNLRTVQPWVLGAAVGAYLVSLVVLAWRWLVLLNVQEVRIGLRQALRLTLLGLFFNTAAPGTVGGDLAKAYFVARSTHRRAAAVLSILMDRLLGLSELALLAGVMVLLARALHLADWAGLRLPAAMAGVAVAAVAGGLALVLWPGLRRAMLLHHLAARLKLDHRMQTLGQAAATFRRHPWQLVGGVAITMLAHLLWISSIYLVGRSLGSGIPAFQYFLYIPLIYMIGAVPLTPGGIGLVERFYLLFFVSDLASPSLVLAMALLVRLIPVACSLPGALVLVSGPRLPSQQAIRQELGTSSP